MIPDHLMEYVDLVEQKKDPDGILNVIVSLKENMPPEKRGTFLLDLEDELCKVDAMVRVWHTPLGDKNSLRNLRGINLESNYEPEN